MNGDRTMNLDAITSLTIDDLTLTTMANSAINGEIQTHTSVPCLGPTYVALRKGGQRQQAYWRYDMELGQLLNGIIDNAIAALSQSTDDANNGIDTLELCLTHNYRLIKPAKFNTVFSNTHRGIRGIELQYKTRTVRCSPTYILASNLKFETIFEQFLEDESIDRKTFERKGGKIFAFDARQVLIPITPDIVAVTLHRGNRIVPLEKLSEPLLQDTTTCLGQWLLRQVQEDGRMVYKYFPSRGKESTGNNLIRQFMATVCLIRYAKATQQPDHWILATHNLNYNLQQFYQTNGELGWVEYNGKVKLGAIALAALAILEHSLQTQSTDSLTIPTPYTEIFERLCNSIQALWQEDGSFRTFLKPSDRNDNQNFYPGEALLFCSTLYRYTQDEPLLEQCRTSFAYYRQWHLQNRNPAFIPWHTQAYTLLYQDTGDRQFLDVIFEMNDWLLSMQQWDTARYPDQQGRFHDPNRSFYGPPHASSTGVYLEGLVDAYRLAVEVGDEVRADAYKEVIWRGLRSVRQLQFRDQVDMFYVSKVALVYGALRTTVYDNSIRVDNVQHCLMALLKVLQLPNQLSETSRCFSQYDPNVDALKTIMDHSGALKEQPTNEECSLPAVSIAEGEARSHLQHFRLLDANVDIQPLLQEIAENSQCWLQNTSRQENVKVQRETNTIFLRSAIKPFPPGITSSNDVHESRKTKMAEQFPTILGWTEGFADSINGELGRVSIVRLAPKGCVYRHIDHGDYYKVRDRYHLVLHSTNGSILSAGDEWVKLEAGEFWWFNNKEPHEAYNESDDWRIHLIFDVLNSSSSGCPSP